MELPSTAKPVPNTIDTWADINGDIYTIDRRCGHNNELIKMIQHKCFGYKYCAIKWNDGKRSTRVHRVIALTFIPNPNNLPIVMHINNKKDDNRVSNLRWGTISENTKQAFDDGLVSNDKAWDDSQSVPVDMYDTLTNKLVQSFGSMRDAARETGYNLQKIRNDYLHADKYLYFKTLHYFVPHNFGPVPHEVYINYSMNDDTEIKRYINKMAIAKDTGESKPVAYKRKPKWRSYDYYTMKKEI